MNQVIEEKVKDVLYDKAVQIVVREQRGSTSLLQRYLYIGYGRAARLIDLMYEDGIIGEFIEGKAREVLVSWKEWTEMMQGVATTERPNQLRAGESTIKTVSNGSINVSIELITPEKAKSILEKSKVSNRNLNIDVVKKMAIAMANGRWKDNGQSISIDSNGGLLNGQHRMNAIVLSGMAQKIVVVKGVPNESFDTIDVGRKRTSSDILGIAGYKNRVPLAASITTLERYYRTKDFSLDKSPSNGSHARINQEGIIELVKKYPGIIESVEFVRAYSNRQLMSPPSLIAPLHYLFGTFSISDRDEFFDRLINTRYYPGYCPIAALARCHDSVPVLNRMKLSARIKAAYWIKTWNYFRKKKSAKMIKWEQNTKFPEII